jgi:hypothetical protein
MKDGLIFTKSQVVKSYPITDFVTWVVVVFVVFLSSPFVWLRVQKRGNGEWGTRDLSMVH